MYQVEFLISYVLMYQISSDISFEAYINLFFITISVVHQQSCHSFIACDKYSFLSWIDPKSLLIHSYTSLDFEKIFSRKPTLIYRPPGDQTTSLRIVNSTTSLRIMNSGTFSPVLENFMKLRKWKLPGRTA